MDSIEITAAGLLLRPWRAEDAGDVHRACQDLDIQRWTSVPAPYRPEHAVGFVTATAPEAWATGTGAPFAVCDATTGELLGSCGLVWINQIVRTGELGYWTAFWARGRGVAVHASRAVTRWAFDTGLRRIIWQAEVGNHASRLVALRAGFVIEGRLRLADPHPRGGGDGWVGSLLPGDLTPAPSGPEAGPAERDEADPAAPGSEAGPATAGSEAGPAAPGAEAGPAAPGSEADPATAGSEAGPAAPGAEAGPAAPGSLVARRAAVFGAPQPVLFATSPEGDELRLRPLQERDLDAIVAACRDPETIRWTTVPDPYQRSDAEFFVDEYGPRVWARGTGAVFAIADGSDGYAGVVELRLSPADPLVGDLGFVVAPDARGRGYCPAALAAVCAWGFTSLDLARIEWRANVGNAASRRAAEKAGFTVEGTARHGLDHRGVRLDAWVGALLPKDLAVPGDGGVAGHIGMPGVAGATGVGGGAGQR